MTVERILAGEGSRFTQVKQGLVYVVGYLVKLLDGQN